MVSSPVALRSVLQGVARVAVVPRRVAAQMRLHRVYCSCLARAAKGDSGHFRGI